MFVKGTCKKCGGSGVFDVGDKSPEEAKKLMSKVDFGECKVNGWHVELGSMADYYILDWSTLSKTEEEVRKLLKSNKEDM